MQKGLPPGWSVSNSTGSWSAPSALSREVDDEDAEIGAEAGLEPEDLRPDSPGWEDVEEEQEDFQLKSLLDDEIFTNVRAMVEHLKTTHDFDLDAIRKKHSTLRYALRNFGQHAFRTLHRI